MAAVVHASTTASTSNAGSYTSGAFTPAAGDVLVVFVVATATTAAGAMTGSAGLTFTRIEPSRTKNAGADTLYCFVADAPATAVSQTVTFTCAGDNASGCAILVARASGLLSVYGAAAVRQSGGQSNQAAGTPGAAFGASVVASNPTLAFVANAASPATLTPPIGWTERADTGYSSPTTGAEYASRDSGFSGITVAWGSASATPWGCIIVELVATKLASAGQAVGSGAVGNEVPHPAPRPPAASATGAALQVPASIGIRVPSMIIGTGLARNAATSIDEGAAHAEAIIALATGAAWGTSSSLAAGAGTAVARSL